MTRKCAHRWSMIGLPRLEWSDVMFVYNVVMDGLCEKCQAKGSKIIVSIAYERYIPLPGQDPRPKEAASR